MTSSNSTHRHASGENSNLKIYMQPYVHKSSVAQSYPTFCNAMDCSTPGFPVFHRLPDCVPVHAHWVWLCRVLVLACGSSSLSRRGTWGPCIGSAKSQPLGLQESPGAGAIPAELDSAGQGQADWWRVRRGG